MEEKHIDIEVQIDAYSANHRMDFYISGKLIKKKRQGRYIIEQFNGTIVEIAIYRRTLKKPKPIE